MKNSENSLRDIVRSFISANKCHRRTVERALQKIGVYRSQHQLLMHISRNLNKSQTEIAEGMEITPATVAVSLKKLEKAGYIEKIVDENDNRFNKIEITNKGKAVVEESENIFATISTTMFQGFTKEELEQFQDFMIRMKDNLNEVGEI